MNETPAPADSSKKRARNWKFLIGLLLAVCLLGSGLFYHYISTGGLQARQKPSALESFLAAELVDLSIPRDTKALKNPLSNSPNSTDVALGRALFQKNCEVCHGFDGRGNTSAGGGMYPVPLDLSRAALLKRKRTDGELFYFIRSGIRNTAMPGWQMPDQQIWQMVGYIRNLPVTAATGGSDTAAVERAPIASGAHYTGSASCQKCHEEVYQRWKKTLMANVVRDPREHPEAIIPDLANADPMVKFTAADVALVYGSKWKQRYFKKVGDDYYVFPAQWDITNKKWRPYFVKDDWWAPLYPPDNFQRPTSALCDGCHSVNYNIQTKTATEWNVGCEKCHGPGSEHLKNPAASTILNPARFEYVAANDLCIQCHSQGQPLKNPIEGKYYDWPVGYEPALQLKNYWKLEEHNLGATTFTHFADGTAHKNRMQGNDYVTSLMYTHGVSCFTCHDAHGTENPALLRKPANELCLDCHGPGSPNGPRSPTLAQHTHHNSGSAGSECVACHMPKIAQTIANVNVRSHTFKFVYPATTDTLKIPNACNACHADQSNEWATAALKGWNDLSPWRIDE